jgi:hypothetical protein
MTLALYLSRVRSIEVLGPTARRGVTTGFSSVGKDVPKEIHQLEPPGRLDNQYGPPKVTVRATITALPVPERKDHKVEKDWNDTNCPKNRKANIRLELIAAECDCNTEKRNTREGKPSESLQQRALRLEFGIGHDMRSCGGLTAELSRAHGGA